MSPASHLSQVSRLLSVDRRFLAAWLLLAGWSLTPTVATSASPAPLFDETRAITLFAFDDVSIPFTRNLKLHMRGPERHPDNPVVQRGLRGAPDSWAVQFYGSVIREGDLFRMWYVAVGDERREGSAPRSVPWRVAYAESRDGIHWVKPNLGLVEYRGSRDNNLVRMEPHLGTVNVKVLLDPDDPDPERRYKMGAHVWFPKGNVRLGTLAPYASRDGLDWRLLTKAQPVQAELAPDDLVVPPFHLEPVGGLYTWDGLFHVVGQNAIAAARPYHGRIVRTHVSADFVNWSQASAVSFVRATQHEPLGPGRSREGEQNHEGLSVWNRNNVLVGVSGRWHGGPQWKDVTVDLGFVVSNDGLQFREPQHEWTFLRRGEEGAWDAGGLLQGQGFENVGTRTLIYYGAWDPRHWENSPTRGGVGIATLPRDRFADLAVDEGTRGPGTYQAPDPVSSLLTRSISLPGPGPHRFHINADGLEDEAQLRVELVGHNLQPLPDWSGERAAIVQTSGFQTPVVWNGCHELADLPDRVRLRITFQGQRKNTIRLSAIYVRS